MNKGWVSLCAAGLVFALTGVLSAGELYQTLSFSPSEVGISQAEGYQRVSVPGGVVTGEVGGPETPCVPVRMVIPPSATVEKVEVAEVREEVLPGSYNIIPVQPGRPFSVPAGPFVGPDPVYYRSLAPLPGRYAEVSGTGTKCGYRIAGAMVYPLQYLPAQKQLILATRLVLKVTYKEGTVAVEPNTPEQNQLFGDDVRDLVSNPGDVSRFAPPERSAGLVGSAFLPAGNFPHVIVTTNQNTGSFLGLRDTLAKLAFWRNRSGVRCTIMTEQDIAPLYTGRDTAERLRNFIKDARATWGTQMVFIASRDVPTAKTQHNWRRAYAYYSGYPAERLPADLYFSDLDGSWDGDHDNTFGETTDSINGYCDIYVGRITLDSTREASKYLRRLFQYEKTPGASYYQKAFLTNDVTFSNAYNDSIRTMTPTPPWKDCRMYASGGDVPISGAAFRDSLNRGWMYTAHIGHGAPGAMGSLYNCANAIAQSNVGKPELIIAVCCHPGAYDTSGVSGMQFGDCLAENMITHAVDGWVGVMMNSRYGWVSCAESYNIRFFESLLPPPQRHYPRLGQAFGKAKDFFIPLWPNATWGTRHRWECYEKNLFGDPGVPLWNNPPTAMTVSHPLNIGRGSQSFVVNVSADQFAVDSAYVCVWKGAEVYATGYTNTSGLATFTINPTTDGTMYVTATKRDRLPYEGNCTVQGSGVELEQPQNLPLSFELGVVSPHPLAGRGMIRYSLPRETQVSLKVYDASGRCVGTLVNGREAAGWKQIAWDARGFGSGVYFYRLDAGGWTATRKLVIVQ